MQEGLDTVKSRGVKIIFDVAIGRTLTIADLRKMGFRAILMGTGAGLPKFMGIPGEELNGVVTANEFLMRYNLLSAGQPGYDTPIRIGRKVVIVGGGNVAMDAARCALRGGAEDVIVMYRRAEEDMPVRAEELERAKEEGIIIMPLTAPLEFCGENGVLTGIRCQKMDLGKPDESGRRSPVPITGSEFVIDGVSDGGVVHRHRAQHHADGPGRVAQGKMEYGWRCRMREPARPGSPIFSPPGMWPGDRP